MVAVEVPNKLLNEDFRASSDKKDDVLAGAPKLEPQNVCLGVKLT